MRTICACTLLTLFAAAGFAQTNSPGGSDQTPADSKVVGVWRATDQGLPFVTLNITNESGKLSGAILFYLHKREAGQPVTSAPGIPEPLIRPKFDGTTLTFQVSHRRAHPPGTLIDPPINFRLQLTGANEGGLINGSEPPASGPGGPSSGFPMVRTEY
jgi:hypothetical protein